MTLRFIMFAHVFLVCGMKCMAYGWGMEYTTEFQVNLHGQCNWANLLRNHFDLDLCRNIALEADMIHIYKPVAGRIADDLQVFSNIEDDNLPASLSVLCFRYTGRFVKVFMGIRNVNEDYFISPVTSLFTNSSCGIFPTISSSESIPNYPLSTLGVHAEVGSDSWFLKASLYNGKSGSGFSSGGVFNVNPIRDGYFGIMSLNSDTGYGCYVVGGTFHCFMRNTTEEGIGKTPEKKEKIKIKEYTLWTLNEIPVFRRNCRYVNIMFQGAVNLTAENGCRNYIGAGINLENIIDLRKNNNLGFFVNRADYIGKTESASEITWRVDLSGHLYIQPSFHFICSGRNIYNAALIRVGVSVGG